MRHQNTKAGRKPIGTLRLIAGLLLLASQAFPERNDWRFWKFSDGLPESFVRSVAAGADGSILVRHGEVDSMSLLDGYGIRRLPEVRTGPIFDWGIRARAYVQSNGEIWAVDGGQLRRYRSGTWSVEAPKDPVHPMLAAVPAGDDRVLVLFSDRLAAYTPSRRTWRVLERSAETCLGQYRLMVPGFFSDFWITGEAGIGRLEFSSGGAAVWTQSDIRQLGLETADYPMPAAGHEVFFSARIAGLSRWAVVRWSAAGLTVVFTGNQDNLRGWRGPDGELWVLDGASLLQMSGEGPESRQKRASGTVRDVLAMPDGSFWLGTSEGLDKYSPSFWRTPAAVADLDAPVHSVAEDAQGRIWFSATEYLLELDGATWRRYPLPLGLRTHGIYTRSLLALADGRLWVKAGGPDSAEQVLVFDPKTGRFETLAHPQGGAISLVVPRRDGTFWVRTKQGRDIELYDGKTFRPPGRATTSAACWKPQTVRSGSAARVAPSWGKTASSGNSGRWTDLPMAARSTSWNSAATRCCWVAGTSCSILTGANGPCGDPAWIAPG